MHKRITSTNHSENGERKRMGREGGDGEGRWRSGDREVMRDGGIFARRVGGIILEDDPVFTKTPPDTFLASNKMDVI